jgi:acyl dehydratase
MHDHRASVAVGDTLSALVCGPITRTTLALYAGASGDHVPLHIDIDAAHAAGFDDVFSHGMLSMAYLGRMLSAWAGQANLREWNARFVSITPVHATVMCTGEVTELFLVGDERRARLTLKATIDNGSTTITGDAVVALPAIVE